MALSWHLAWHVSSYLDVKQHVHISFHLRIEMINRVGYFQENPIIALKTPVLANLTTGGICVAGCALTKGPANAVRLGVPSI